jgi:hypothetical protein
MLRHMENGRFARALRALRQLNGDPPPPPHALWRLGRWFLEKDRARRARRPLRLFLELYPAHQDRPEVMRDLARAVGGKRARNLVREAHALGKQRDRGRRERRLAARAAPSPLNGS